MRKFQYVEPGYKDIPITVTVNEDWILRMYWPHWSKRMVAANSRPTWPECLMDFQTVHWAWELH